MCNYPEELYADHCYNGDRANFGEEEDEVSHAVDGCHKKRVAYNNHECRTSSLAEAVTIDGWK